MSRKIYSKAFTLIELLTVASIILVLSGAIIVNLNIARKKSRDAARKSDLKQIQTALESYATDHGYYTNSNLAGFSSDTGPGTSWNTLQTQLSSYIPQLPVDPRNSTSSAGTACRDQINTGKYCYEFSITGDSYYLLAPLETLSGNGDQFTGQIGAQDITSGFFPEGDRRYFYILESHPE